MQSYGSTIVVVPRRYRSYLEEELGLVETVYNNINDIIIVRKPNRKYYIPIPYLEKIKTMKPENIIIMDYIKPRHIINLYRELHTNIIDRVQLILQIFANHAGSREAQLQIELARIQHELPLIREMIRASKMHELPGFLGSGEYAVDKYYRYAKKRAAKIRRELDKIRKIRAHRRDKRLSRGYPHVALVGYTSAGKTTLFNRITGEAKKTGSEPFTTLSPKISAIKYKEIKIAFIDTVGFIRDLPVEVIEAFYATLEEAIYSDIIINVVDISRGVERAEYEILESLGILSEIGVHGKPVITALNKIDLIPENNINKIIEALKNRIELEYIIPISAEKGININKLMETIYNILNPISKINIYNKHR